MQRIRLAAAVAWTLLAAGAQAGQSTSEKSQQDAIHAHYYAAEFGAVYAKAIDAVFMLNWKIKSRDPGSGLLVARTPKSVRSFGDDVTILVHRTNDGRVRVDVTSDARLVGGGLGKNKKNIREFFQCLDNIMGVAPR